MSAELLARVRAQLQHATDAGLGARSIDVKDLAQLLDELEEAWRYINRLRVPLLYEFGTTDPELLLEIWRPTETGEKGSNAPAESSRPHGDRLAQAFPQPVTIGDPA